LGFSLNCDISGVVLLNTTAIKLQLFSWYFVAEVMMEKNGEGKFDVPLWLTRECGYDGWQAQGTTKLILIILKRKHNN
jgi:hypothetical protein